MSPDKGSKSVAAAAALGGNEQLVKKFMILSLAVGLVPIPIVDMAALTGIQLQMLSKLSKKYDVEFSEQRGKALLGSLLGGGSTALASAASSRVILHLIPMAGTIASGVSTAVFAGASTFAVGKVFIEHFESGGTFLTFDPERVREYYAQQFQQGTAEVGKSFVGIKP